MKDLAIIKSKIDQALNQLNGFEFIKQTDAQYVLSVDGGLLNIYFKKNGKTSFLSQGQNPDGATAFAQTLIELSN